MTRPRDGKASATMISIKSTFASEDLGIIRSCKVLRQKLLPLLAKMTDGNVTLLPSQPAAAATCHDIAVADYSDFFFKDPCTTDIRLSKLFRAGVRRLTLPSRPLCMPDPFYFENLEEIHLADVSGFAVDRDTWQDVAKLLVRCRADVGDAITLEEWQAMNVSRLDIMLFMHHVWVPRMVKKLKAHDSSSKVRVVISHQVHERRPYQFGGPSHVVGKVLHDVTAGTITREPSNSDSGRISGDDNENDG